MTRVDFYVLPEGAGDKASLACRVAEKAYLSGHRVYIHTRDESQLSRLDELLWTFKPGSFVPHERVDSHTPDEKTPVLIGIQPPPGEDDVLVNLAPEVPECFERFTRIAELVDGQPEGRAQARTRFRFYRERGFDVQTHELSGNP